MTLFYLSGISHYDVCKLYISTFCVRRDAFFVLYLINSTHLNQGADVMHKGLVCNFIGLVILLVIGNVLCA